MKVKHLALALLAISLSVLTMHAQEQLSSIQYYPGVQKTSPSTKTAGSLQLPFIEDFSSGKNTANPLKWINSQAFINTTYSQSAPSIGMATLDAMDSDGKVYEHATVATFEADMLSSQPINLDIGGDTTLYLSFYFQPGGLGDQPEPSDSLILEFYSPQEEQWIWTWSSPGFVSEEFTQVLIPVRGAIFLMDGFQFRFRNLASLANAYEPGLKTNADHWHLDYIYLAQDRGYQDFAVNDLTLRQNSGSLLLNYQAIPWEHFRKAGINEVKTIFPMHLGNLSSSRKFYEPQFEIIDEWGGGSGFSKTLIADEIQAFQELLYDATFNYAFSSNAVDTARFTVKLDINSTESDLIPQNDISSYTQEFANYYAYDDGSAEAGYGITGEGANTAKIALRYDNFYPGDSLVGIEIYFNRSFNDANRKYFQLAIWNDIDGKPGDLLYLQEGARNSLTQGINGFDYFKFDTAKVVPGSYYIGIHQVTPDFLNIGFDRNTQSKDNMLYRVGQEWKNTSFAGSLMMRPIFANKSKKTSINEDLLVWGDQVRAYPNPIQDLLNLEYPSSLENAPLKILNIQGRVVYQQAKLSKQINLQGLAGGTYLLIVHGKKQVLHNKIIKL